MYPPGQNKGAKTISQAKKGAEKESQGCHFEEVDGDRGRIPHRAAK